MDENISLDKLQSLKGELIELFSFVQQSIDEFVSEYKPALEEGTQKSIETSKQLVKVASETEKITNEMLNHIDDLNDRIDKETEISEEIKNDLQLIEKKVLPEHSQELEKLQKKYDIADEDLIPLKEKYSEVIGYSRKNLEHIGKLVDYINQDFETVFELMNRMQFQDITAQQISSATTNINQIYDKLSSILSNLNMDLPDLEKQDLEKMGRGKEETFDSKATLDNREERQKLADELMNQNSKKDKKENQE